MFYNILNFHDWKTNGLQSQKPSGIFASVMKKKLIFLDVSNAEQKNMINAAIAENYQETHITIYVHNSNFTELDRLLKS